MRGLREGRDKDLVVAHAAEVFLAVGQDGDGVVAGPDEDEAVLAHRVLRPLADRREIRFLAPGAGARRIDVYHDAVVAALVVDQELRLGGFPALVEVRHLAVPAEEDAAWLGAHFVDRAAAFLVAVGTPDGARLFQYVDLHELAAHGAAVAGSAGNKIGGWRRRCRMRVCHRRRGCHGGRWLAMRDVTGGPCRYRASPRPFVLSGHDVPKWNFGSVLSRATVIS